MCDKMISQIEQAKARNAIVIAAATGGDKAIKRKADHLIYVPPALLLTPVLLSPPLCQEQLGCRPLSLLSSRLRPGR